MTQKNAFPSPAPRIQPRRVFPRWLMVVGALAVLLGLASMVAPFFIPWDKLKDEAVLAGSKALGRELGIGRIEVSLFSGVHIRDLQLANAKGGFSEQALFTNSDAKVDVNLLSLFTGKLVINSITFIKPQLLIETNARGLSNLRGLGGEGAPASAAASAAKTSAPESLATATVGGRTFPALLMALVIQDGDVILRDRQKGTETAVHGLNIKLEGLSLAAAGASRLEADMTAELQGKKIPLSLTCDFKLDMAREKVDIKGLDLTAPGLDATMTGSVEGFDKPEVDLRLGAGLDLGKLPGLLPPSVLAGLPPDLETRGTLKLDLGAKGGISGLKDLALEGGLTFDDVSAVYGSYPAVGDLRGTMSFDKSGVDLPALTFKLGGDPVTFALNAHWGDLENVLGPRESLKASVRYSLRSPKLNLDPLLAAGSGLTTTAAAMEPNANSVPAAGSVAPGAALESNPGPLPSYAKSVPRGLSVDGSIDVDSMVVRGFTTGKMTQRLALRDQRITSSTDLWMYQGRVYERSVTDLSRPGPAFRSSLGVSGLAFHKLVDDAAAAAPGTGLALLKGKVDGVFTLKASVQGRGFRKPFVLDNTRALVDFWFQDGVIRGTDTQERLAGVIPYPAVQRLLRSGVQFSTAEGEILYAARRATLKRFDLGSGRDWRQGPLYLQAEGTMDVGGGLDFKITPHFNPSLNLVGGDLGRAFEDEKGWPTFDYIEYGGPSVKDAKADFTVALNKAARKAVSQHVDQIKQVARQALEQKAGGLLKQLPGGLNRFFGQ